MSEKKTLPRMVKGKLWVWRKIIDFTFIGGIPLLFVGVWRQ